MNLLPCLTRTSKRPEESVQETLAAAVPKIMASFGNFANDNEIKVWLLPLGMSLVGVMASGGTVFEIASGVMLVSLRDILRTLREIVYRCKFKGIFPEWMDFGALD